MIHTALTIKSDLFKLQRSTTSIEGLPSFGIVNELRTSESAFDVDSPTSIGIKKRAFDVLGVFPYQESLTDGFQTLRYNRTAAYVPHYDWIDPLYEARKMIQRSAHRMGEHYCINPKYPYKSSSSSSSEEENSSSRRKNNMMDAHDYDSTRNGTNRFGKHAVEVYVPTTSSEALNHQYHHDQYHPHYHH